MSTLLLVHGLPATGKTTLAQWLARELCWPVVHKDDVKEILFDTLGWKDRAWSRNLGVATIEILYHIIDMQLAAGVSCIVENNFKPEFASPRVQATLARTKAGCIQVYCHCDGLLRLQRFTSRTRHPGHADIEVTAEMAAEWQVEQLGPLRVDGPIIDVDTTDMSQVDYAAILCEIKKHV